MHIYKYVYTYIACISELYNSTMISTHRSNAGGTSSVRCACLLTSLGTTSLCANQGCLARQKNLAEAMADTVDVSQDLAPTKRR